MVSYQGSDPELARSLALLAARRVLSNGDEVSAQQQWLADVREETFKVLADPSEENLHRFLNVAALSHHGEPESVTARLFPYRLIQEVIDRPDEGMDRVTVEAIVRMGSASVPLLIGVLRDWARQSEMLDPYPAQAALALLGEIGDETALQAIRECVDAPDPIVTTAAKWAAARIAGRTPGDRTVYDFCCAAVDVKETEAEAMRDEGQAQDRRIADMLLLFLKDSVKTSEMHQAFKMFLGPTHEMDITEDEQMAFFDWLLNDYVPADSGARFPKSTWRGTASGSERAIAKACRNGPAVTAACSRSSAWKRVSAWS